MSRQRIIAVLMALHPRRWRAQYDAELRDLLEDGPLTMAVVLDVVRNAARQHAHRRPVVLRVIAASAASVLVEVSAVRGGVTDNILWPPSTPLRVLALAALLLPWLPAVRGTLPAVRRRRPQPAVDQ